MVSRMMTNRIKVAFFINKLTLAGGGNGKFFFQDLLRDRFTQKKVYTNKTISTQQCDYNENIQFNEKGIIRMKHTTLTALRDFMLHGLEIQVVEQKVSIFLKSFKRIKIKP
jgi:hypothetical protein